MENLAENLAKVVQELGQVQQTAHGKLLENKFEVDLNTFQSGHGSEATMQILFDGPELAKEQAHGRAVFPHKTNDDVYGFVSIRVKGNAQEALDNLKALLEGMGLSEEMIS